MLATSPIWRGWHVTSYTPEGHPYLTWESHIPRINEQFLESTVYLYASTPDAVAGARTGGSGFIVGVPCEKLPDRQFLYCVTNAHVIEAGGCTIRINMRDGSLGVHDTLETDWVLHPDHDDVAIFLLPGLDPTRVIFKAVPTSSFVTKAIEADVNLGIGDEVFFGGRFINSEGRQQNTPALRFGNISQMRPDPIEQKRVFGSRMQESILVEGRTISGYSGSPVFTLLTKLYTRQQEKPLEKDLLLLLGIVWGYISSEQPIKDAAGRDIGNKVTVNTGMMGVVPVWKLEELLNSDAVKAKRSTLEAEEIKRLANSSVAELTSAAEEEASSTEPADANPQGKEDFMRLLDAAAKDQLKGD